MYPSNVMVGLSYLISRFGELRSRGTRLWTPIAQLARVGVGSMLTWRQWLGGKVTTRGSELRHDGIFDKRIDNCAAYGSGC